LFFVFFKPFSFHAKSNTPGDQKQHERESEERAGERKRQRGVTVRRVFEKAKRSLSLYTQLGMDLQGSKLKQEKYMHSFGGCTYVCHLQKLE
jgi:hypothetical protein